MSPLWSCVEPHHPGSRKEPLWFEKDESQRVLWPSTLRLSLDYYESLTRFAVPLDERAIAALAHSAMALDIYCWLAQRLHRIPEGKSQLVPWTSYLLIPGVSRACRKASAKPLT